MTVTINGEAKEIAALALELQERQQNKKLENQQDQIEKICCLVKDTMPESVELPCHKGVNSVTYKTSHENVTLSVSVDLSDKENITEKDLRDILSDKYVRCSNNAYLAVGEMLKSKML